MKRIISFIFSMAVYTVLFAQYDGALDPSFGTGGKVITDFQQHDYAYAIALQPDGKIILAGYSTVPMNPGHNYVFAMARYNPDGTLDNTFGTGGRDTFDLGFTTSYDETAWSMALQPDGKIILAGNHFNTNNDFALARFNADGSIDNTFGTNGVVMTNFGTQDVIFCVALQPDGKIVACGYTGLIPNQNDFALARYNSDGTLDNTFGTNGKVITDFGDREEAWSLKILADGKLLVGGFSGFDFAVARYNSDGTLDNTFGGTGKLTTDFVGNDCGRALVVQNDGKYVLWGFNDSDYVYNFVGARYNTNGSLDNTFGSNGKAKVESPGQLMLYTAALQIDNKFVVGGEMLDDFFVARFLSNGAIDNSFDTNGIATVDFMNWGDQGFALAIQPDNKIVLGGNIHNGSNRDFALCRLLANPTSGMTEQQQPCDILVYPNPAGSFLNISNPEAKAARYSITDALGRTVKTGTIAGNTSLNITDLTSGNFFIQFDNGYCTSFTKR